MKKEDYWGLKELREETRDKARILWGDLIGDDPDSSNKFNYLSDMGNYIDDRHLKFLEEYEDHISKLILHSHTGEVYPQIVNLAVMPEMLKIMSDGADNEQARQGYLEIKRIHEASGIGEAIKNELNYLSKMKSSDKTSFSDEILDRQSTGSQLKNSAKSFVERAKHVDNHTKNR